MKQWYEELFENYGIKYDRESFVQGTIGECDFIEQEINYDRTTRILDVGCGTGRHSILGAFSRSDRLTTEDYEMLVIAEK